MRLHQFSILQVYCSAFHASMSSIFILATGKVSGTVFFAKWFCMPQKWVRDLTLQRFSVRVVIVVFVLCSFVPFNHGIISHRSVFLSLLPRILPVFCCHGQRRCHEPFSWFYFDACDSIPPSVAPFSSSLNPFVSSPVDFCALFTIVVISLLVKTFSPRQPGWLFQESSPTLSTPHARSSLLYHICLSEGVSRMCYYPD